MTAPKSWEDDHTLCAVPECMDPGTERHPKYDSLICLDHYCIFADRDYERLKEMGYD